MIRINLLPPEIIEKRKYERYYPYVLIVGAVLAFVILAVWGYLQLMNGARTAELQSIEQSAADLRKQAEVLSVFELKETELKARQQAANAALAGRVDIGRVAEEVSLVLPEEVWLTQLELHAPVTTGDQTADAVESFTGYAPAPSASKTAEAFKSVASTLVRLASLSDSLQDVWLNRAQAQTYGDFQGLADGQGPRPIVPCVEFVIEAQLKSPASQGTGQ